MGTKKATRRATKKRDAGEQRVVDKMRRAYEDAGMKVEGGIVTRDGLKSAARTALKSPAVESVEFSGRITGGETVRFDRKGAAVIRTFETELPCVLTDAELQEKGQELAATEKELVEHNTAAKSTRAALTEGEKEIRYRIGRLATSINAKQEHRTVTVEVRRLSERMVAVVRTDTGEQVLERPADDEELQAGLFEGDVVVGANGVAGKRAASDDDAPGRDEEE